MVSLSLLYIKCLFLQHILRCEIKSAMFPTSQCMPGSDDLFLQYDVIQGVSELWYRCNYNPLCLLNLISSVSVRCYNMLLLGRIAPD